MTRNTLFMLMLIFCISNATAQLSTQKQAQIDSLFSGWNTLDAPGGAIGIVKNGEFIYSKAFGAANLDYNIPNTLQSVFGIASTSKQFTAACIMLLEQQGKLSLDDKLTKFFPEFPPYANSITIQHLLNHTSGIRDYLGLKRIAGLVRNEDYFTDKETERWIINQKQLNFTPGKKLSYSNSGYWLLGQIVGKVSGISLREYAEEHIFSPLEMNNTHFHNNHKQIVKNRVYGYAPNAQKGYDIKMYQLDMIGAGGVLTTIEDLKKWDDAFYGSEVLNQDFWNKMTQVGTLNNGTQLHYAAGLGVENYKGLQVIRHGGAFAGFGAELIRFPEHRFSVIFLANRSDVDPSSIAFQIADIFLHDEFMEKKGLPSPRPKTNIKSIALSLDKLQKFEGSYWDSGEKISRKLEIRNDTLNYVRDNGRATKMIPIAEDQFQWAGTHIPILMKFDNKDFPQKFTLHFPKEEPIQFTAYSPVNSFSSAELDSYSGDYYNADLDIFYTLKIEANSIMIYTNGNCIAPLNPLMENVLVNPSQKRLTLEFNEAKDEFKLSIDRIYDLKFVRR